jgi:hypothetical protein
MIDIRPHIASTHIRNDYASLDAYIDKSVRYRKSLYIRTLLICIIPMTKLSFLIYFVTSLIHNSIYSTILFLLLIDLI